MIFEESDGRLWSIGTDMMAPDLETAQGFADGLNARIGLDTDTWMALAERVFAERRQIRERYDSVPSAPPDR